MMTFVDYIITSGGNDVDFKKLRTFLLGLSKKYQQRSVPNLYDCGTPLRISEMSKIELTLYTPGLSDDYLDEVIDDELESRKRGFEFFGRFDNAYPPSALVAFLVIFGDRGDDMNYIAHLNSETKAFASNGRINPEICTDIKAVEATVLEKLLEKVRINRFEIVGEY